LGRNSSIFDHSSNIEVIGRPQFEIIAQDNLVKLHDAPGMLDNTYKISSQLKYTWFINNQPDDDDGILRSLPLLIQYKGVIYPHLSLATFMQSLGESRAYVEDSSYGPVIRVGAYSIPISEKGFSKLGITGRHISTRLFLLWIC
jgi:adenylate cyclase